MSNEETIFAEALGKGSPSERDAYVTQACGGNAALRRAVDALLHAHERAAGVLEAPPFDLKTTVQTRPSQAIGSIIGRYKLLEQIGGGGMGVVYMAEQSHPVRRKVALKIIKPGMDSGQVIARFEAERQALTMMDHPNIAKVLDAGTTDAGRPYFVMELVKGVPITDYCDEARLDTRQRLELFIQVCHAVQHAHQKGIIHRDLKPSNVLVTLHDDRPVPKVIDFGIAKATGQVLTDKTLFTNYAQMLGTPLYMSPEQAQISGLDVDTRSDVYSLGVLLYELLTGTTPFDKQRLREAAYDEMRRIIREEEPPRPSTRLSTMGDRIASVSAQRHTEPKKLSQLVHGELDWIVMKSLEKERARRYETANGFARDVQRYLGDEPVQACPPSAGYRLRKFARRNKGSVAAIAAVVVALSIGFALSTIGFVQASRQRAIARSNEINARIEAAKATTVSDLLQEMLTSANPDQAKGADYTVRQLLDDSSLRLSDQLKGQPEVEAVVRAAIGNAYRRLVMTDKAEPHLQRALAIRRELAGDAGNSRDAQEALAQSLHDYGWNLLMAQRHADAERHFRDAVAIFKANGIRSAKVIETLSTLQLCIGQQQRLPEAEAVANEALAMGREIFPEGHGELANVLHRLAEEKLIQRDLVVAEALSRQAVAMHVRWHGEKHPETAFGFVVLGKIQSAAGRHAEAEANYRRALHIMRAQYGEMHSVVTYMLELLQQALTAKGDQAGLAALQAEQTARLLKALERDNGNLKTRIQLADFLRQSGDLDGAIAKFDEAVELAPAAAPEVRLILAEGCSQLARLLRDKQRPQPAEQMFRHAISLREPIGKAPPALRLAQANDYNDVAFALKLAEQSRQAEQDIRAGMELKQALVREFPAERDYRIHLAHSFLGLGHVMDASGRRPDAIEPTAEAEQILYALAAEAPPAEGFRVFLGHTFWQLGYAWGRMDRLAEADRAFQQAVRTFAQLSADFPANAFYLQEQGFSHRLVAGIGERAGRKDDAERHFRDSVGFYRKLVIENPSSEFIRQEVAVTARALADLLLRSGRYREASEALSDDSFIANDWRQCLDVAALLARITSAAHGDAQVTAADRKALEETCAARIPRLIASAVRHCPQDAQADLNNLAWSLAANPDPRLREPRAAVQLAQRGVELDPRFRHCWNTLGAARYRAGDFPGAIVALEKSMELSNGGDSFDFFFLAMAHRQLHDREAARKRYEQAVAWMDDNQPDNAELRRFRTEAEELLKITHQKPTTKAESK